MAREFVRVAGRNRMGRCCAFCVLQDSRRRSGRTQASDQPPPTGEQLSRLRSTRKKPRRMTGGRTPTPVVLSAGRRKITYCQPVRPPGERTRKANETEWSKEDVCIENAPVLQRRRFSGVEERTFRRSALKKRFCPSASPASRTKGRRVSPRMGPGRGWAFALAGLAKGRAAAVRSSAAAADGAAPLMRA